MTFHIVLRPRKAAAAALTAAILGLAIPSGATQAATCLPATKLPVPLKNTGTRVAQMCRAGKALQNLDNVLLIGSDNAEHVAPLPLRHRLDDGEGFVVPADTSVDVVSSRGDLISLANGVRATLRHEATDGESYAVDGSGIAEFDINGQPTYWRVEVAKGFVATTKGATFSVALADPKSVTFAVTRGSVSLTRFINARIASTGETLEGLRAFAILAANGVPAVTYERIPTIDREFKDDDDANAQLSADLASAKVAGDPDRIEGARDNLALFYARPTIAVATADAQAPSSDTQAAPPRNNTILYITVGASIAATVIYAIVTSHKSTQGPTRVVTVPSTTTTTTTASSRDLLLGVARQLTAQHNAVHAGL